MKKAIALFGFFLFCATLIAQEDVTFNFSFKGEKRYRKIVVKMYVNGTEVLLLKNGSTAVYKASLDVSKPVTVRAKYGLNKQDITFLISPGNKCALEASFFASMLDLNLLSGGRISPGTGSKSSLMVNKKDLSVSYTSITTNATDTIRQQWLAKGGKIKGVSYDGAGTFISMNKAGTKMSGYGGQFSIGQTYLNFRVPENKPGIRTWSSLVYGFSVTWELYGAKATISEEGMDPMTASSFNSDEMISFDLGYTLGLGKFKNNTKWKGVAFVLKYKPSFSYGTSITSNSVTGGADVSHYNSFNYMGYGFDINFNNYTSNATRLAPKAQSKFTFFMLPPIKNIPMFITIGYGLTFYIRRN